MTATLDWYGCATFRLKTQGLTLFLDAYIDRVPGADGPPGASADDIEDCDYILVGHSHFDHIWGADRIALRTGAKVIGSYETVRILANAGVPEDQLLPVSGGETIPLGSGVSVEVYPALHSCLWAGYDDQNPSFDCLGDKHVDYFARRACESDLLSGLGKLSADIDVHMRRSDQGCRGDGGTLCYVIATPEGRLFFKDTPGHWSGIMEKIDADVGILAASGRANVDGEPIQGALNDFLVSEAEFLGLKRVVLCHHDAWLGPIFPGGNVAGIREEFAMRRAGCEVLELEYVDGFDVFSGLMV
ncbi:MBL fold metallo-hydrolase [Defluviimonas salinarum]|uniref:MBL fold metallo-hydrolase n=1 Tax=Defluviimonas salinarum TaxID=2992147 RepID=A0ABT3J350_9RHOB|nr:MBL fold metallo-hydrolase [Defluviimonas salinarum]MCW3782097.1 MBL fold metallo-hydrolase [Defluviimonas salinarum]